MNRGNGLVLIAERDRPLREALVEVVRRMGIEPIARGDAAGALDTILTGDIRIAVIEFEILVDPAILEECVRSREGAIRLVALASGRAELPPQVAAQLSVQAWLEKPFSVPRFREAVHCATLPPAVGRTR